MSNNEFGLRLKELRGAKANKLGRRKIPQREVAAHLNISPGAYGSWESGRTRPDIASLPEIADYFEVSVDYVLGHTVDNQGNPEAVSTPGGLTWSLRRGPQTAEEEKGVPPGSISIIALIESALGVERAFQIVSEKTEPNRLFTVAFGAADFALDMGIEITKTGDEISYPRARLAVACRAAGMNPPLDTPFMIDLKDIEALEVDAKRAKQFGFQGKLCIHPNQVEICNKIFSPTKEEIEYAKRVVQAFNEAESSGTAAIQVDGKFVDYPVMERSKRILRIAQKISCFS